MLLWCFLNIQDISRVKYAVNITTEHFHPGSAADQWQPDKQIQTASVSYITNRKNQSLHAVGRGYAETRGIRGEAGWSYLLLFYKLSFAIFKTKAETCSEYPCSTRGSETVRASLQPVVTFLLPVTWLLLKLNAVSSIYPENTSSTSRHAAPFILISFLLTASKQTCRVLMLAYVSLNVTGWFMSFSCA